MIQNQQSRRGNSWTGWWQLKYTPPVPSDVDILVGGFRTDIQSVVLADRATITKITGFNTSINAFGGASTLIGGFDTDIDSVVQMDGFVTAEITGFKTSIDGVITSGNIANGLLRAWFDTSISAYGGAEAKLGKFSTSIDSVVSSGTIAIIQISGFKTSIASIASVPVVANIDITGFKTELLYGVVSIGGFKTTIVSESNFIQNNSIAYSINIKSNETTKYLAYDFDYILRMNNKYYGVKNDGFYLLEGTDDNGTVIPARFKTSMMDFGTALHKRVPYMYLDSDNETTIKTFTEGVEIGTFESAFTGRRTRLSKGNRGRFFNFEIANIEGNEMKVGSLEIYPEVLSRKV